MYIRNNTVLRLVVADYRDMCTRIKYESELKVRAERGEVNANDFYRNSSGSISVFPRVEFKVPN